jgi:hypothetical protein
MAAILAACQARDRKECDEMIKLMAIEIFYTRIISVDSMAGLASRNSTNPDRVKLIDQHLKALESIVTCAKALTSLGAAIPSITLFGNYTEVFLEMLQELSQRILDEKGTSKLNIIIDRYPVFLGRFDVMKPLLVNIADHI